MTALTVGSLFSGIGGLDLGLERAGMRVIWQSEIDDYACRVLKKHWPEVPNYGDIKRIEWGTVERPDVICGGYPCQPFSTAGKRKGTDDPRHLWPWVREAISELRPRYAILENVRGHLSMGGVAVIGDLASIGYNAEWRVISAASVGANHRRDRIIIVAYPDDTRSYYEAINPTETGFNALGRTGGRCENVANTNDARSGTPRHDNDFNRSETFKGRENLSFNGFSGFSSNVADTPGERLQGPVWEVFERRGTGFAYSGGEWWKVEPDLGRVANGVPARVDRLKGLGNAVVPQVAEIVGRLVVEHSTR